MAIKVECDEGEYAPWAIDVPADMAAPWDDLTGGSVTLTAEKSGVAQTPVDGDLDDPGADGKVHGGGGFIPAEWTAGSYYCTVEVAKPGVELPLKQSFDLEVKRVAKKPPP